MNKQDFFERLKPMETDPMWIGKYAKELNKEISTNMWALSLVPEIANDVSIDDFLAFFERVIADRQEQVNKMKRHGMLFYAWYDLPEGQLRFNCISEIHKKLPFENKIEIVDSIEPILETFLNDEWWEETLDASDESDELLDESDEYSDYSLKVFVKKLEV